MFNIFLVIPVGMYTLLVKITVYTYEITPAGINTYVIKPRSIYKFISKAN